MEKFLKLVARDIYNKYGADLTQITIVFPNRRSGVFFQKFLSELTDIIVWAPKIITINDLMKELSGLSSGDKIWLILQLYNVYKKVLKTSETFDSFYYWGEMLINDFDDIDKYIVNVHELFQSISAEKEIEVTFDSLDDKQKKIIEQFLLNLKASRDSKQKQDFINFWKALYPIYKDFSSYLFKSGLVYEGKIYRKVAEDIITNDKIDLKENIEFAFVGFNVLNKCEEILFNYLQANKIAHFYWDYDEWYLNDNFHEAQFFIKPNTEKFPNALASENFNNLRSGKNINLVSVSSKVAQVKILPDILDKHLVGQGNDTAIVLADESLLINLLNSIPDSVTGINVTMGFPVKHSQVVSLINKIYNLRKNLRHRDSNVFYLGKDVQNFISHYIIRNFISDEYDAFQNIFNNEKRFIIEDNIFDKTSKLKQLFEIISNSETSFVTVVNTLLKVLLRYFAEERLSELQFEKELIYHIIKETNKIVDILKLELEKVKIDVQNKIVNQVISNQSVSFVGEPIADLQIMGILESRALDFENLVILSMNEGIIPRISTSGSFIPYSLREGFGLQTIRHQDSVFSYYFFRLIQRAKNVFLVYNSASDGLSTGEPSRYLQQLIYNPDFIINAITYGFNIDFPVEREITIKKSEEVLQKLNIYLDSSSEKYFSPSALNDLIDCSLRFYFKYIQELKSIEDVDDNMEAKSFGNILHNSLQQLYQPYLNEVIGNDLIEKIFNDEAIREIIQNNYLNEFRIKQNAEMLPGENTVLLDIIFNDVKSILSYDQIKAPFTLKALENKFEKLLPLKINAKDYTIRLGGKIDRMDEKNDVLEIIDYKTSNPDLKIKSIEELFDPSNKKRKKEVFQLMFYALLLQNENAQTAFSPQLYITRKMNTKDASGFIIQYNNEYLFTINDDLITEFKERLTGLLAELFNSEIPFKQTDILEKCSFCDFKDICKREKVEF